MKHATTVHFFRGVACGVATAALALFTVGCASKRFTFSRYTGEVPREWPTQREAMAEEGHGFKVPVYRTWPDRPYEVLGSLRYHRPYRSWNNGTIKLATKFVEQNGGEAMVLRYGEERGVDALAAGERNPGTRNRPVLTGLVIRMLTTEDIARKEAELAEKSKKAERLWQDWDFQHPGARFSQDAREVVLSYLGASGVSPTAGDFASSPLKNSD